MVVQESKMPDSAKSLMGKQGNITVDRKHRLKHRFEVVKKLGQGTYGKVQLAINKETGQEVAIKTIKKSKIESDQDLVRIRREIQIMSSVQHPHIIHIYEVFENKEKIVLVMQYASGGELYDYLSDKKVLTDTEARRVFRQIAAAIYYCHKNKICHRDLKLENVLLDERGNAKIADFGLSNVFDDRHLLSTYCGSPLYASPEIVKGTPYYGPEVDCWSMGVLLYTLVYGAMPFDGSNFKRLVKQISEGDYYEPKKKSEASGLIRHLLTVNPSKRATIIDICADWWVNSGFEHSLLQVAEDTANLTPVRIDLLLALAPVSPPPNKLVEEPQFETTEPAIQPEEVIMTSSGHEDSEGASHDGNGEVTSDSFAFVSGGMSTELARGGNPDDLFEARYGSDEEFLSAEAAAALEGQCFKRERSSDVMRVSSIAHKDKKPRKSDSAQMTKPLEARPEVVGGNAAISLSSDTLVEEDVQEEVVVEEKPEDVSVIEPTAGAPESDSPKEDAKEPSSDRKPEPVIEKEPVKVESPKEKKVKRKIVSKKQVDKKAEEAKMRESSPSKMRERSVEKVKPKEQSPEKTRTKSPEKSRPKSPEKSRTKSPEKTRTKSPVKSRQASPDKPRAKSKSPEKAAVNKPAVKQGEPDKKETKASPGRILIRRKSEMSPESNETKPPVANNAVRKPGKLVMPRFLDSAQAASPSPKAGLEPKKLVLPMRSVLDAKKAFETKKSDSVVVPGSRKSSLAPAVELKEVTPKIEAVVPEVKPEAKPAEELEKPGAAIETSPEPEVTTKKPTEAAESLIVPPLCQDAEENLSSLESTTSNDVPQQEATPDVTEDQKKAAAKSILKKSLAKARLAERKLSQQSSFDSDVGSQSSTPVAVPSTPQTEPKSYFKVPKPFNKELMEEKVPDIKPSGKSPSTPQDETIWGTPLSPTGSSASKLKRSVLSSSIESEMNNWRKEMEESLKRLSPEGASEENTPYHSQNSVDSEAEAGPAPITRSYKKFTFTKDGSTITETGEVYTKPATDGTWTKVEKKTKVTTQPTSKPFPTVKIKPLSSPKPMPQAFEPKLFKESSPLRHSDSQSSSGSNDIFDDIFDSWTGDSVFSNLLKMDSVFDKFTKNSLKRHDSRRSSLRRPKTSRERELRPTGHSTDRESSDNDEDFDFHFDGNHPVSYGSHGLMNLMKSVNKDFNHRLRAFKERQGSFGRSLSRDRGEQQGIYDMRARRDSSNSARSVSRDRVESPRSETVLRFVIDPLKKDVFAQGESRGRLNREDGKVQKPGPATNLDGYTSDYTTKYSSSLNSPDSNIDRASSYESSRAKPQQRAQKVWPREGQDSPTTPQSTRSGPELYDPNKNVDALTDNRRRRVERWLETNTDGSLDKEADNLYSRTTRSLLSDVPEFATIHDRPIKTGFMKYSRSNTDRLSDYDEVGAQREAHLESGHRSHSQANLEHHHEATRPPVYRTTSEIKMQNNKVHGSHEHLDRSQSEDHPPMDRHQSNPQVQSPMSDRPPRQAPRGPQGFATYTRSSSSNLSGFGITTNPDGSIEMETPSMGGSRTPMLRMRLSFGSNEPPRIVTSTQQGLWNQDDMPDGSSLLEALKTQGYRNIMTQRLFRDPQASPTEQEVNENVSLNAEPEGPNTPEPSGNPQRGKDCPRASDSPAEKENNACCMMETNNTDSAVGNADEFVYPVTDKKEEKLDEEPPGPSKLNGYDHRLTNGYGNDSNGFLEDKVRSLLGNHRRDRSDVGLNQESLDFSRTRSGDSIGRCSISDDYKRNKSARPSISEDFSRSKSNDSVGYEEESVSERILRKSFYSRFNDDRPKRKPSRAFADTDYLFSDVRGGLWSRFSEPESSDELPSVSRRSSRRSGSTTEKRSSANLDDILDATWLRKSESRNSSLYDDYLSDDDAWASKPPLPSNRRSTQSTRYNDTFYEKPGSLWNQRRDSSSTRSYKEAPSVIDTVPDLTDRRRSRSSAFSFYSPLVTPKSPVIPSRPIVQPGTDANQATENQFNVLEGLERRETMLNRELNVGCWAQSNSSNGSLDTELNNSQIERSECIQQC